MKNKIYILVNDTSSMVGEAIQAANEALRLLLGAWYRDPWWCKNLEVEIWLASGSMFANYSELDSVGLEKDILCSNETFSEDVMAQCIANLLALPSPDGRLYYKPQLVIVSNASSIWKENFLQEQFEQSCFTDCLFLESGETKSFSLPFSCTLWRVDEINPNTVCNFIKQQEMLQPRTLMPVWSHVRAKRLERDAKKGDADSQFQLANCYRQGLGVSRNISLAHKWYLLAAKQKHADALFQLGELHWLNLIGKSDWSEAKKWYLLAAEQMSLAAMFRLGMIYKFSHEHSRDDSEAIKWWTQAAEQGHLEAQNELDKNFQKTSPSMV